MDLPSKIVMFHCNEDADTLHVHFEYASKSVDSKIGGKHGEIILAYNSEEQIANVTIMH